MTKAEYLRRLNRALKPLEREERRKTLEYYGEMIDDRVESGLNEAEAVKQLERPEDIARDLAPATTRKHGPLWTALIILGSPVWLSLLIALAGGAVAVLAAALAVAIALCACLLALALAGVALTIAFIPLLTMNIQTAFFSLGAGFILLGLALLSYVPVRMCAQFIALRVMQSTSVIISRKDKDKA